MKTAPLAAILVSPKRQRKEFDLAALSELAESIKKHGLLHPIVVREEGATLVLVAGERRLRAIHDIFEMNDEFSFDGQLVDPGYVPYVTLGELDELAREEAEWEENNNREDLTWQEKAEGSARLESIRRRQAEARGDAPPPVAQIAQEIRGSSEGVNQETTRREIIVAKHLSDPEVRGAKDVNEAFKILRRKEDQEKRKALAAEVGRTFTATLHTVLNVDALEWMKQAPTGTFDVILTDPIYGIGADEFGDSGGAATGPHEYEDSYEKWKKDIMALASQGFRITKPEAHFYAFCDVTRFEEFKAILSRAGWKCFRTPFVWHKPNGSRAPWPDMGPQRKYEFILYAVKGNKKVTRLYPDLITYSADENLGHNAQKPVNLFLDLLKRSVAPGDSVLDPFAGSGPILPAAHELKCKATAIEIDPAAYALCVKRMEKLNEQPELEGL